MRTSSGWRWLLRPRQTHLIDCGGTISDSMVRSPALRCSTFSPDGLVGFGLISRKRYRQLAIVPPVSGVRLMTRSVAPGATDRYDWAMAPESKGNDPKFTAGHQEAVVAADAFFGGFCILMIV